MKKLLTTLTVLLVAATTMAQVPSYVPTNGLVGYWPFNGNANDESGNGNNGTVNGATLTTDRNGNANAAYDFDDNIITIGNNGQFELSEFTLSFWGLIPSGTVFGTLATGISNWDNGNLGYWIGASAGNPSIYFDGLAAGNSNILDDNWHMLSLTYSGGTATLYLDGILELSTSVNYNPSSADVEFGNTTLYNERWNGKLDDIGIWDRALSATEVLDMFDNYTGLCQNLIANPATVFITPGDSVQLIACAGYTDYLWSNGDDTQTIWVSQEGTYTVQASRSGYPNQSASVEVVFGNFNTGGITIEPDTVSTCMPFGGVIEFVTETNFDLPPFIGGQATAALDAFRITGIDGLPNGLNLITDVMVTADNDGPYGYWYNTGTVPNQIAAIGQIGFTATSAVLNALSTGGINGDGVYTVVLTLDSRVAQTTPDLSSLYPNGNWASTTNINSDLTLPVTIKVEPLSPPQQTINTTGCSIGVNGITYRETGTYYEIVDAGNCLYNEVVFTLEEAEATTSVYQGCPGSGDTEVLVSIAGGTPPYNYNVNGNMYTAATSTFNLSSSMANFDGYWYTWQLQDIVSSEGCEVNQDYYYISYPDDGDSYPEQLCLVTVDSASGYNQIQWQKTDNEKTDYYVVMKENNQTSQFDSIGWVAFDSLSVFTDYNSNPNQTSDRYGLVTVDSCGNVGFVVNPHRTIHLSANQGINGEVNLNWNAYEGFTYNNFEIYRSNNAGPFNLIGTTSNSNFSYSDLTPPSGTNYYRVAVVNPNGCAPTRSVSRSISNVINSSGTTVGIEAQNISPVVSIYPNPSHGNFAMAIEGIEGIIGLSVFDARGREVLAKSVVGNRQRTIQNIDLSDYANGVYTLSIRTAKGTATQKLVKE
jgi:hypothetical protein